MTAAGFEDQTARLRPELLAHCYRMMGSAVDAEDQVQETFLRAWRAFHDFDGRSSVRTWMYRIATNCCLTALSAASRRVLPTGLGGPPGDPEAPLHARTDQAWLEPLPDAMLWTSAEPTPEESLLARENITLAWTAALQHLPPQQRAVLLLREVLGFTAAETAQTLDTTVAAVNSALQRSRATIGGGLPTPATAPDQRCPDSDSRLEPSDVTSHPGADSAVVANRAVVADSAVLAGRAVIEEEAVAAFVVAFERHDFEAVVQSLAPGARWQMPPFDRWYDGAGAAAVLAWTHCPAKAPGDLRYRPTRCNGGPAVGVYLRKGRQHEAFQLQVLHVDADGRIDDVVGWFEPHLFRLAGLPLVLPD